MRGPRIVAGGAPGDGFRIVEVATWENPEAGSAAENARSYVLEMEGKADALGVERWEEVSSTGKPIKLLLKYIVKLAVKQKGLTNAAD
jgi:hypothetical protein